MFKLKILIATLAVCSFAMLTACGKGFKGTKIVSAENNEQISLEENELPVSKTVVSVDEQAVAAFAADRERIATQIGADANASFNRTVEAISLLRVDAFDGASTTTTRMTMTVLYGCDANEQIRLSGVVNLDTLSRGGTVRIGQNQTYEYFVACTDTECQEMVATIRRSGPSGVNAVVHYGLVGQQTAAGDFATDYEYVGRQSSVDNFFKKSTVAWYREQCLIADAETQGWSNTNTSTGGIDESLWTNGNSNPAPTFTNNGGWNPERPEDTATSGEHVFPGSGGTFPYDDPDQSGPF